MSRAAARAANEWWADEFGDDFPTGTEHNQDAMLEAFVAGWNAASGAEWVDADDNSLGPYIPGAKP